MEKHRFFLVAALACLLPSCQRQMETPLSSGPLSVTFHAGHADSPDTRTVLQDDGRILWLPGEAIKLFYGADGSSRFVSTNTAVADRVDFTGSLEGITIDGQHDFWAVYPYSSGIGLDGEALVLSLPDVQEAVPGTFADGLFPSIARTRNNELSFYNVCGGVKFSVRHEGIRSVVFRGNAGEELAGEVKVGWGADGKPVVREILDGKPEIVLEAPDGAYFQPGEWYYIAALPTTLAKGYTLSFYRDVKFGDKTGTGPVSIKRAVWGVLEEADAPLSEPKAPEAVDMGLSVAWASHNLGAGAPESGGYRYAWGEIGTKGLFAWSNYAWADGGSTQALTKYVTDAAYGKDGTADGKTLLDPEDDAASQSLGGFWRMPTREEWAELSGSASCSWTRTTQGGVSGYEVKSLKNGNTLFLPVTEGAASGQAADGAYWSASLDDDPASSPLKAASFRFDESRWSAGHWDERCLGLAIRPVYAPVFRLLPAMMEVEGAGGEIEVEIVSALSYEISSMPAWITEIATVEAGLNRYFHTFRVSANESGAPRTGVIVFCNENSQCVPCTLTQAVDNTAKLEVDPQSLSFSDQEGSLPFSIVSNQAWTVSSNQDWCQVSPASGSGDAAVTVQVSENLSTQERQAVVQVVSSGGALCREIAVAQGGKAETPDDFSWSATFLHRSLFMRFTATWCGYCPIMANTVKLAQSQHPGKLEALNLHAVSSNLAFAGTATLVSQYGIAGYPSGIVDGRRLVENYSSDYAASLTGQYMAETEEHYPVSSAIRFTSSLSGRTLDLDVTLYLRHAADYKITVVLLESGIVGYQADYIDGAHSDYVHNDIARMALTGISGDAFTVDGDEASRSFHYTASIPGAYDMDKMKVLVYVQRAYGSQAVLASGAYGDYYVDNCASAELGATLPPTVEE